MTDSRYLQDVIHGAERGYAPKLVSMTIRAKATSTEISRLTRALLWLKRSQKHEAKTLTLDFRTNEVDDASCAMLALFARCNRYYDSITILVDNGGAIGVAGAVALARARRKDKIFVECIYRRYRDFSFDAWFVLEFGYECHVVAERIGRVAGRRLREYICGGTKEGVFT